MLPSSQACAVFLLWSPIFLGGCAVRDALHDIVLEPFLGDEEDVAMSVVPSRGLGSTGCPPFPVADRRSDYDKAVQRAYKALVESDAAGAAEAAEEGIIAAERESITPRDAYLLLAEARIRLGEPHRAEAIASSWLEQNPDDLIAQEVLAKAFIASGQFERAQNGLDSLLAEYRPGNDRSRICDLLAFARALDAYSKGEVAQARTHLRTIADTKLKKYVESAFRLPKADCQPTGK